MIKANEFWLHLHILSEAHEAEGRTARERLENIAEQFHQLPPVTQRELLSDLTKLMACCPELHALLVPAQSELRTR